MLCLSFNHIFGKEFYFSKENYKWEKILKSHIHDWDKSMNKQKELWLFFMKPNDNFVWKWLIWESDEPKRTTNSS